MERVMEIIAGALVVGGIIGIIIASVIAGTLASVRQKAIKAGAAHYVFDGTSQQGEFKWIDSTTKEK